MGNLDIFKGGFSEDYFEKNSLENGFTFWYASFLAELLGYESLKGFNKALNKATATCITLGLPVVDNFIQVEREVDGKKVFDYKLSRFACYLAAMNGDNKKPAVAAAQVYFANLANAVQSYLEAASDIERIVVREDISEHERALSGTVNKAGVENYAFFQGAGYRGMYNMSISKLRAIRQIETNRSPLDFMGSDELAANLFRLTQTELKIRTQNIQGQKRLENVAENVGRKVRETMIEISGITPETLSKEKDIKEVKKDLKKAGREMKALDKKPKKK